MLDLKDILAQFNINEVLECNPFGSGHINSTYKVICENKTYVLQRINTVAFKEPEKIMQNIGKITEFLKTRAKEDTKFLNFLQSKSGDFYYKSENGEFWRCYELIDESVGVDTPNDEQFYECALAFGRFQNLLSDFDADLLYETIPDFHNTPKRYENFLVAVQEDKVCRVKDASEEIEFVNSNKDFYSVLIDANKQGVLPLRVSHNDTKSNNVLLDEKTNKAVCVIDLDTIMPGFSVTDFGDAIRFGANTASEDEKDLSKVNFDLNKFEIYTKGFIKGCAGILSKDEIMLLCEGAKMMTLECGMRFLTDYLQGDVYFKTAYPEHNLVRCRTQFKLAKEMDKHWEEMKKIVGKYAE